MGKYEPYIKQVIIKESRDIEKTAYPFNLNAVKHIGHISFSKPVTFLLGENGVGKSTIIEAIAVALGFNPEGGNKNTRFETNQTHAALYKYITLIKSSNYLNDGFFFRAESMYNWKTRFTTYYKEFEEGYKDYHTISHGEGMIDIFKQYLRPNGIYILDEPEVALSPTSQFVLLGLIDTMARFHNTQFIISTHSPILAAYEYADIYEFDTIHEPEKVSYEQTLIYTLYTRFLQDPMYRKKLIESDESFKE